MDDDLKTYLAYQKEQERLSREISEIVRLIAVKKEEIQKLEDDKSDLVYQSRENAEVIHKMEAEAKNNGKS